MAPKQTPEEIEEGERIEEEINEEIDEEIKEEATDADVDIQEELNDLEPGAIPQQEETHNTLKFLKEDVLGADDRFKTANLTWEELGRPTFSTRFWLNLANTCQYLFDFGVVSEYCKHKARITTDTSLSRDGFIISTSVTQRRLKEKKSQSELADFLKNKK